MSGKRRYAAIRGGIEEHLLRGLMSAYEFGLYVIIHLQCDYRTGLWWGSASRLMAAAPGDSSLRSVQRALQQLQERRYIRTFRTQTARGNYPVLIDKYEPHNGPHKGYRLDAWATPDPEHLVWVGVSQGDGEGVNQRAKSTLLFGAYSVNQHKTPTNPSVSNTEPGGFEPFWEAYPRKVAKPQAMQAWRKIAEAEYPDVLAGLAMWRESEQWANPQFVPYPATFLNRKQWQDVPIKGAHGAYNSRARSVATPIERVAERSAFTAASLNSVFGGAQAVAGSARRALPQPSDPAGGTGVHPGAGRSITGGN